MVRWKHTGQGAIRRVLEVQSGQDRGGTYLYISVWRFALEKGSSPRRKYLDGPSGIYSRTNGQRSCPENSLRQGGCQVWSKKPPSHVR